MSAVTVILNRAQQGDPQAAAELLPLARELRDLTRRFGARLLINDRVDVALAVAAVLVAWGLLAIPFVRVGPPDFEGPFVAAADQAVVAALRRALVLHDLDDALVAVAQPRLFAPQHTHEVGVPQRHHGVWSDDAYTLTSATSDVAARFGIGSPR